MSSMGMDKSGNQTLANASTWEKLTSFTVRSGYPSTVITNSTLVMNDTTTGTLRYRIDFDSVSGTQRVRVVLNGTTIVGAQANRAVTTTVTGVAVNNGDTLELQGFASGSSTFREVLAGSANTFLEFNQTVYVLDGAKDTAWNRSGTLANTEVVAGTRAITWNGTGVVGLSGPIDGVHDTDWNISGGIYQGQFYDVDGTRPISWNRTGTIITIPRPANPPSIFTFNDVSVSIHTVDGRSIGDIPCDAVLGFSWGREQNEVSICDFDVASEAVSEIGEDIRPWLHWVTFWHDDVAVWTGPIQTCHIRSQTTSISSRDPSTFMWRTRLPISRTWVETTPAHIAELLWRRMFELHRVRTVPVVLETVGTESFSITATADQRMLYQFMDDLVKVGLNWTVIAGRPVLGDFPSDPVAELQECDFMVELERLRDGTQTFNDIRVQGQNYATTVTASLAHLNLQNIVSIDDVFGVSNITKAARQYVRDQAQIRDVLYVPPSATLNGEAPVTLNDLVPGKSFIVHAQGLSSIMRLDGMTVSGSPSTFDVQVTLVADRPDIELSTTTTTTGGLT